MRCHIKCARQPVGVHADMPLDVRDKLAPIEEESSACTEAQ